MLTNSCQNLNNQRGKSGKNDFCDKNWSFDTVCTLARQTNAEIAAIDIKTAFIMCSLAAFGQRLRILRPRSMHSWNERHRIVVLTSITEKPNENRYLPPS